MFTDYKDALFMINNWFEDYKDDKSTLAQKLDDATSEEIRGEFRQDILNLLDKAALSIQGNNGPIVTEVEEKVQVLQVPSNAFLVKRSGQPDNSIQGSNNIIQLPGA